MVRYPDSGRSGPCTTHLRRLYSELAVELSSAGGELPDHIAVELEALAYALSAEATHPVARSLFFDHLRHWLPPLCRAVAREAEQPFYRDLGAVTLDWLGWVERYFETANRPLPDTP